MSLFSLAAFKIHSSSFAFDILATFLCVSLDSLSLSYLESMEVLWCVDSCFIHLGKFSAINSSNILFPPLPILRIPLGMCWYASWSTTGLCGFVIFFFILSYFCSSAWIIFLREGSQHIFRFADSFLLLAQLFSQVLLTYFSFQLLYFSTPEFLFGSLLQFLSLFLFPIW